MFPSGDACFVASPGGLPDDAFTAELVANAGRYESSHGEWICVPVGEDTFPALQDRDIAIVPAKGSEPERLYYLHAFGHFDLTNDGPIVLP